MTRNFNPEDRNKYVLSVKKSLQEKVAVIKDNFFKKPTGTATVEAYTRLIDDIIVSVYKTLSDNYCQQPASADTGSTLSLIAIGGYGRGELNIGSDIDILFLYEKKSDSFVDYMASNVLSFLWDIGLEVGHSSRSINDCLDIAKNDFESLTALMESRPIIGSGRLYSRFSLALNKYLRHRGVKRFIFQKIHDRKSTDTKNINSIFISEPDIKESPGGLRDVHAALWTSRTAFSAGTLKELQSKNIIDTQEHVSLNHSLDLIFMIRNALHIYTGKKSDILVHEVQKKITEMLGYVSNEERSGVDSFLRDYYTAAYNIHIFSDTLIHRCLGYRNKNFFDLFRLKELEKGFVQYKDEISLKKFNETVFAEDPYLLFDVFRYAQQHNLKLSENLKRIIRKNLPLLKDFKWESKDLKEFLFSLLNAKNSFKIFQAMHEVDVLGLLLPEFGKCKFQIHNDYFHMYTVDVHCLQSIEKLENLHFNSEKELAEFSSVYQSISRPEILKLSLLLHDAGKAEGTDHIETGLLYLDNIIKRLALEKRDAKTLKFLMKNHVFMNHIAQRRDLSNKETVMEFAGVIKKIELLKMLYVHTCADIMAVSPAIWTEWKGALLWELYHKTYYYLMVDDSIDMAEQEVADTCKKEVFSLLKDKKIDRDFANYYLDNMPIKYFASLTSEMITKHLSLATELDRKPAASNFSRSDKSGYWELSVCTKGKIGTFSKISGILSARSMNILSAQVYSGKDGLAINTFQVTQSENTSFEETELFPKIAKDFEDILSLKTDVQDIIKSRRLSIGGKLQGETLIPTTVIVNNEASENYTVLEVVFQDRLGSLYLLTKTFYELGMNIINAKISTDGKRGFDVFYVSNPDGTKIVDETKLTTIKSSIEKSLE